jgi:hypothetical protein
MNNKRKMKKKNPSSYIPVLKVTSWSTEKALYSSYIYIEFSPRIVSGELQCARAIQVFLLVSWPEDKEK